MTPWEIAEFLMGTLTTVFLAVMGMIVTSTSVRFPRFGKWFKKWGWYCIAVSVIGTIVSHAMVTVKHHKYDPELALRFEDKFEILKRQRAEAASAIYEYMEKGNWDSVTNTDGLDDVLGFFDELGFYWQNGELSAIVLHEHFYDEMRIFCAGSAGYIAKTQKAEGKAVFANVEPLFDELTKIETADTHHPPFDWRADKKAYMEDLKYEMRLKDNK